MLDKIPSYILDVKKKFQEAGFEIYLVGGCVRDMLLDRGVKDWDFTTNATPEQMQELFPDSFYDNSFGTVGIPLKVGSSELIVQREGDLLQEQSAKTVVEVTTYRTEEGYTDRRH